MVEDIDSAVEAVVKLSKSVVLAAAANPNKGSPIVTWPRITFEFTTNYSDVHLLKPQPRTLIIVAEVYEGRSPPLTVRHWTDSPWRAHCSVPLPVVPEPRVVLQSISLQPTQKVQEVRSDSLRSGNIAVLILVHAGGRLPSGSGTAFALPYSP